MSHGNKTGPRRFGQVSCRFFPNLLISGERFTEDVVLEFLSNETVGNVADLSERDPYVPVDLESPLESVVLHMVSQNARRVFLQDVAQKKLVGVLTQFQFMEV